MGYDGKINKKLKLVEFDKCILKRIPYKLQYDNFKLYGNGYEKVLEYVQKYYINNNNIIEENLINDLNTFKTYRDDIQQEITMKSLIEIIWSVIVTIVSILVAIYIGYIALKDYIKIQEDDFLNFIIRNIKMALILISLISAVYLALSIYERTKLSKNYKLKYINNVIYTLETIKEDMDKNENSGTESDEIISSVNESSDDCNTEDITTEDADECNTEDIATEDANERYEGLELTEVKEIRTYTYKATKNKYSPRAMHERKRR